MMLAIGTMRHRVEIQEPDVTTPAGDETPDWETAGGKPAPQFKTMARRWVSIEPLNSRELFQAQQVRPDLTHKIKLHYRGCDWLTARHRVKYGKRIFNLLPPRNVDEINAEIEVYATEEV